jgi:hypothetical protein
MWVLAMLLVLLAALGFGANALYTAVVRADSAARTAEATAPARPATGPGFDPRAARR